MLLLSICRVKKKLADKLNLKKPKIEFGEKLRELRLSKNFTMVDLAVKCDTDSSYIGKIERGQINPGFDSLHKILTALDINITTAIFK